MLRTVTSRVLASQALRVASHQRPRHPISSSLPKACFHRAAPRSFTSTPSSLLEANNNTNEATVVVSTTTTTTTASAESANASDNNSKEGDEDEKVLISACGDVNEDDEDEDEEEEMFVDAHDSFQFQQKEWGGPRRGGRLPEPTRFGDWERKGRCTDF